MELSSVDHIHQAFVFIDSAVRDGNWAEARKWLRRVVPALERLASLSPAANAWLDLIRCSGELGRILVREDKARYGDRFAQCMQGIAEIAKHVPLQ